MKSDIARPDPLIIVKNTELKEGLLKMLNVK